MIISNQRNIPLDIRRQDNKYSSIASLVLAITTTTILQEILVATAIIISLPSMSQYIQGDQIAVVISHE